MNNVFDQEYLDKSKLTKEVDDELNSEKEKGYFALKKNLARMRSGIMRVSIRDSRIIRAKVIALAKMHILFLKTRAFRLSMKAKEITDNKRLIQSYIYVTKNWIKSIYFKHLSNIANDKSLSLNFL